MEAALSIYLEDFAKTLSSREQVCFCLPSHCLFMCVP